MINSKEDLLQYMAMDKYALGEKGKFPKPWDEIWKFEIALRKHEYYVNCTHNFLMQYFYRTRHHRLGIKLGFSIPINVLEGGMN